MPAGFYHGKNQLIPATGITCQPWVQYPLGLFVPVRNWGAGNPNPWAVSTRLVCGVRGTYHLTLPLEQSAAITLSQKKTALFQSSGAIGWSCTLQEWRYSISSLFNWATLPLSGLQSYTNVGLHSWNWDWGTKYDCLWSWDREPPGATPFCAEAEPQNSSVYTPLVKTHRPRPSVWP